MGDSTVVDADLLGIIASGIFLVRLLPQPLRLARTGVSSGVSPLSGIHATIAAAAWLVYGVEAHLPLVWGVSVAALVPSLWTNALLWRRTTRHDALWGLAWLVALVGLRSVDLLSAGLAGGVLVTQGPQVRTAVRSDDLGGLAPATWWVSLADAASWGAYGWALGDAALLGYAVVLSSCATIVLVRLRATRDTNRHLRHVVAVPGAPAGDQAERS